MSIISEQSLTLLRSRGQTTDLVNGVRKVSNSSYMSRDSMDSQTTVEIPDEMNSVETLEFLEFNAETAAIIYNKFIDFKEQDPDRADIFHFAKDHVRSVAGDALLENDDWCSVMQRIGLKGNYQARILDPTWKHMRLNSTAKEIAIWMMEMRFEFLETLDSYIQTPTKGVDRKVSHLDMLQPGSPRNPSSSTNIEGELPGFQLFYKGGSMSGLDKLNNPDGSLSLQKLVGGTATTDFNVPGSLGLYLTKQEKVAFEYAGWAKKVVDGNVVPVGIMCVAIPNDLLSSITQVVGDDWNQYVWCCRHREFPPDHLEYLANFQWITGGLCRQSNKAISKMSNRTQLAVWKLATGEIASQHYTSSGQMLQLLNNSCVGRVWITNLPGTENQGGGGKKTAR